MKEKLNYKDHLLKARQICSLKEYCSFDIEQKLLRWDVNPSDIQKIISDLKKNNFLNDERYAKAYANDKLKFNKWGKYKIKVYLKQKRITEELINIALEELDNDLYIEILENEIDKKSATIKGNSSYEKKAKLLRFIVGKGFETELANEYINSIFRN